MSTIIMTNWDVSSQSWVNRSRLEQNRLLTFTNLAFILSSYVNGFFDMVPIWGLIYILKMFCLQNLVNGYVYKGKPMIIQFGRNSAAVMKAN